MLAQIFQTLQLDLLTALDGVDPYAIVQRLLLNERPKDSPEDIFRILGFVHLYTASGIHIYAFLDALDGFGKRLSPKTATKILLFQKVIRCAGIFLIFFAWGLQQFRLGFLRPILVFLMKRLFESLGFRFRTLSPLFILLGIELLFGALAGPETERRLSFGRAHYFLAVGGGLLGYGWAKTKGLSGILAHAAMSLSSWLCTAVLDLFSLGQIAYLTPLISLLTIPILAQATYPGLLLLSLTSTSGLRGLSSAMNSAAGFAVELVDRIGGVFVVSPHVPMLMIPVTAICVSLVLTKRKKQAFFFGVLAIVGLRILLPQFERSELTLLNVGQGDSLLSIGKKRTELIDTGMSGAVRDRDWIDTFTKRGKTQIDAVLLSHWDEDHVGALRQLVRIIPIGCIQIHSEAWNEERGERWRKWFSLHKELNVSDKHCIQTGEVAEWALPGNKKKAGNDRMLSFFRKLSPSLQFVSFGDAPRVMEDRLVSTLPKNTPTIWKVNHHGSHTSTPLLLGSQIKIQEFWISAGRRNRYGHPHKSVLDLLGSWHAPVRKTTDPTAPHYYKWQWLEWMGPLDLWNEIRLGLGISSVLNPTSKS